MFTRYTGLFIFYFFLVSTRVVVWLRAKRPVPQATRYWRALLVSMTWPQYCAVLYTEAKWIVAAR